MLLSQTYLRQHGLAALCDTYKVTARRAVAHPNLVLLKYSQIESDMGDALVKECRGIIYDEADDWALVSFPFRKFFNAHEPRAATIDWATAKVQEKLDGSMMTLYWYAGAWRVASSGSPDAGGDVWGHSGTFADLFWETWRAIGWELPPEPGHGDRIPCMSFMFEMMTPFNRVVVPHAVPRLTLIGARNLDELLEVPAEGVAEVCGWTAVRSFPLQTIDDCITAAAALDPMESEGFVVVDAAFNRIKIKSPRYVALHSAKDGASPGKMLDIVRSNEGAEFLSYFPQMKAAYDRVAVEYAVLCDELEREYAAIKHIESQKEFALAAQRTRCSSPLFNVRLGRCATVREFFATANRAVVERALKFDPVEVQKLMGRPVEPTE